MDAQGIIVSLLADHFWSKVIYGSLIGLGIGIVANVPRNVSEYTEKKRQNPLLWRYKAPEDLVALDLPGTRLSDRAL